MNIPDGLVTDERCQEAFVSGLQAMREMLARFVEQGGHPETAESMRLNWRQVWGVDPGQPDHISDDCWDYAAKANGNLEPCAACGKKSPVEKMLRPHGGTEDLVCDEGCAESWNDRG